VSAWGTAWGGSWWRAWGSSAQPFYPVGGYPGKKRRNRIEVEHEGSIYEFEDEAAAKSLIESIAQEYKPKQSKKEKTPPAVSLRVDEIQILAAHLKGYSPARAVLEDRFDLIYDAAQQALEDEEEAILLLM